MSSARSSYLRAGSVVAAVLVHAGVFGAMRALPAEARVVARHTHEEPELFEVDLTPPPKAEEPPPPPPAVVEPPPPPPVAMKAPAPKAEAPVKAPEPPPKAEEPPPPPAAAAPASEAAQAAEVVTAEGPADDAKNSIVSGNAAAFAGGVTASAGTSATAIRDTNARADGVKGGTGTAAPDRSRPAELIGGKLWDCPLPSEAEDEGVEHVTVQLRVGVSADGRVETVEIVSDPGYGFGREALRCMRQKRFKPALDAAGTPVVLKQIVNVSWQVLRVRAVGNLPYWPDYSKLQYFVGGGALLNGRNETFLEAGLLFKLGLRVAPVAAR